MVGFSQAEGSAELTLDDIFFMICYAVITLAWVAILVGPTWKITMYFIRSGTSLNSAISSIPAIS